MKNLSFTLLAMLIVSLLNSCDKSYKYVETVKETSIFGGSDIVDKEPVIIKASCDSAAYLEAYQKFCISCKVTSDFIKNYGTSSKLPIKFNLYTSEGIDITNILFINKQISEKSISDMIFLENSTPVEKKEIKLDSAKIDSLSAFFNIDKDEFDPNGKTWYITKDAPEYLNANGIYCYFQVNNGKPSNFRMRIQYYADDWLFFHKIQFLIDDKAYEYIPSKTETDSGNGGYIWEWSDENIYDNDVKLLSALYNAKTAKMKLLGDKYHKVKTITAKQISSIKRSVELYEAMGGTY